MAGNFRVATATRDMVGHVLELFDQENELSGYAEAAMADPLGRILVALDGHAIVGALIMREVVASDRSRRGGVDELLVHHDFRDRGVGRTLMAAAEDYWRSVPGITGMQITVRESNEPALHLYSSLGYREVQRRIRMYRDW